MQEEAMALFPPNPGKWASRAYGDDPAAWDEAKRQCRALLITWAHERRPGTYSEVSSAVTAIEWPDGPFTNHGQQMGYLLGQVSIDELSSVEDRPVLSTLVIGQDEGMPSHGYWNFIDEELGLHPPAGNLPRLEFWVAEFAAACDFFGDLG